MENSELQRQESQPLKTSEDRFIEARRGRKIKFASQKEVWQSLSYAMVKIGLRGSNMPVPEEKLLLIQHVYENFPENTTDEIKLAFDWGIEGRLDEDINCFENFSCLYFTRIMRAYNRLAIQVKTEQEKQKLIQAPTKIKSDVRTELNTEKFEETQCAKYFKKTGLKW